MLDIRPSRSCSPAMVGGKSVRVDFVSDGGYKERALRIGTISTFIPTYHKVRSQLLREHEDFERTMTLLEFKNKGARFVVEVPRISID